VSPQLQAIVSRLSEARVRLQSAQHHVEQVVASRIGGPDGDFAYRQAIKEETEALRNYVRIMREYRECLSVRPRSEDQGA
jgi:hypothetical protein